MTTQSRLLSAALLLFASCSTPQVPRQSEPSDSYPQLYPDYVGVTIPSNLCPLTFTFGTPCSEGVVRITAADGSQYLFGDGRRVVIPASEWHRMMEATVGDSLCVESWTLQSGRWTAHRPFAIHVAPHPVDPYISYRLIPPSYVAYEELVIEQRSLDSYDTRTIYNNMRLATQDKGQCINCHSYQNYGTQRMLFHIRKEWGGTLIAQDGEVTKVDLKTPEMISAGVYPSWHPQEALVAFSTNNTAQTFHTVDTAKIEVFDSESDLILYDVDANVITDVCRTPQRMEVFPTWSPDGRWLYYCAADSPFDASAPNAPSQAVEHYRDIRYDLYRRPFDAATRTFGTEQLLYRASAQGRSATLPRLSPDGRWMVFAQARWGCFHVWHPDADIYVADLMALDSDSAASDSLGPLRPRLLAGINSASSESYPSFSSNGRWVMTASRRDDGNYTRPYIAYFDPVTGQCSKPFELPQESPLFYTISLLSFNRPEFMTEPVRITADDFARVSLHGTARKALYHSR